jgi:RES domain-containing protein
LSFNPKTIVRGGPYYRVCDPRWINPSDTSYSKASGGRWNPPDRNGRPGFGALYLNATLDVARANARRHAMLTFSISLEELLPDLQPDLQAYAITDSSFVDAVSDDGISLLGLAASYPVDIPHPPCQGIAEAVYADDHHGIAVRSAVTDGEELVLFDRAVPTIAVEGTRRAFTAWYGPA